MNARMDTATALKVSLALTDADRLPPRQYAFESPKEHRERAERIRLRRERGQFPFEDYDEYLARRRRPGGLEETEAQALRITYQNARSEWLTWCHRDRNTYGGLNREGLAELEGCKERAIELRNMIYGTER